MLELPPRLVILMAGDVHLAVLADLLALPVDENRRVVAMDLAVRVRAEFGVAEGESDSEPFRLVEERLGLQVRHLGVVVVVELGWIIDPPAGEERGQGQFGVDEHLDGLLMGVVQQRDEPLDHVGLALISGDRAQLGGAQADQSCHVSRSSPSSVRQAVETQATISVPVWPAKARSRFWGFVIRALRPPFSRNSTTARILGSIEPGRKCPPSAR